MNDFYPDLVPPSATVSTSANSPDTLPLIGYKIDQLKEYILRKLGKPVWNVEISDQQALDCIQDALQKFSLYRPLICYGALPMVAGQKQYLKGVDVGQGVAGCTFVENRLGVLNLDFGNPFTTMSIMTTGLGLDGMGDYDSYLRWQKTWQRVTSTQPDWLYDEVRRCLWIHNPIARYRAAVCLYLNWKATETLPAFGADWVKEYALAKAALQLGENWQKFSGAIPGPAQNLQLDNSKISRAEKRITDLETQLRAAAENAPVTGD